MKILNVKKAEEKTTELVFIIDRSGSMAGLEKDTIGGFNSMLKKQKADKEKCFVSTVLFDSEISVICDRQDIKDVKPMTENEYCVGGCTALLDALGGAIHHISNIHKYARKSDVPNKTLFVVITDGFENASRKYNSNQVKNMVEKQKNKYEWEFIFLGANIDSVETARNFGFDEDCTVDYCPDSIGTANVYEAVNNAVSCIRQSTTLSKNWSENVKQDFKKRSK